MHCRRPQLRQRTSILHVACMRAVMSHKSVSDFELNPRTVVSLRTASRSVVTQVVGRQQPCPRQSSWARTSCRRVGVGVSAPRRGPRGASSTKERTSPWWSQRHRTLSMQSTSPKQSRSLDAAGAAARNRAGTRRPKPRKFTRPLLRCNAASAQHEKHRRPRNRRAARSWTSSGAHATTPGPTMTPVTTTVRQSQRGSTCDCESARWRGTVASSESSWTWAWRRSMRAWSLGCPPRSWISAEIWSRMPTSFARV